MVPRSHAGGTFEPVPLRQASVPCSVGRVDRSPERGVSVSNSTATERDVIVLRRHTIDVLLISLGAVAAAVLAIAGGLLMWGSSFADDYVGRELGSQNISFPSEERLTEEAAEDPRMNDLMSYAGEQVDTGEEAEVYATYIGYHIEGIGGGLTYSELGTPEREAKAAVVAAQEAGATEAEIAELQATADGISAQRNTVFKGETLRGLLLSTYAWSTVGAIAGIAAIVAFVAAAAAAALVVAGLVHLRKQKVA